MRGATNWYATSFNPDTKLFYVMAVEDCSIYRQTSKQSFRAMKRSRSGRSWARAYLRAINIETGATAWENSAVRGRRRPTIPAC